MRLNARRSSSGVRVKKRQRDTSTRNLRFVAQCVHCAKLLMRSIVVLSLLCYALAETHDDGEPPDAPVSPLWWHCLGAGVLFVEFVLGFFFFVQLFAVESGDIINIMEPVAVCAAFLHLVSQALPFIVMWRRGWVDCYSGIWWPVHWTYGAILVVALPQLTQLMAVGQATLPILGWTFRESTATKFYIYMSACLNASDQYLDCMSAAVAINCGWPRAYLMVWVICVSLVLQAFAAWWATGDVQAVVFCLFGGHPESMAAKGKETGDRRYAAFAASQGVAKLVTENCPQAYLTVMFALEAKPSNMVWISVGCSFMLAFKAFVDGLRYFCGRAPEQRALE